jgi:dTMP kinase
MCEAYLYASSRAQALRSLIAPVLKNGGIVISDRSFFSSIANQGFGKGLGFETIMQINSTAVAGFSPDKIIFMDLPIETGISRSFDKDGDKFESLGNEFYSKVHSGYKHIQSLPEFKDKWVNIDASKDVDAVFEDVLQAVDL